ncbi:rhodanese-like domain-containing protein [Sulfitobacter sp. HNIBRBA3233]|uniref:rhodanese-like domain-containing protein n=1 Tax=Sulfitobacter marinivivus TaxID=3158558 RepID=UPI0032DFDFD6
MSGAPSPDIKAPRRGVLRRGFLFGAVALGGIGAMRWFNTGARIDAASLSVTDAAAAARRGEITLIDIRRPDEWARTGIGRHAVPIDMRRADFTDALLRELDGDRSAALALICARGVRSRGLTKRLRAAGFDTVYDVPEGMLGSGAGPGWIGAGLPVARP